MARINRPTAYLKQGDGRVAELLVALVNSQGDVSVDVGDIALNTDDLESLLQGISGSTETPSATTSTGSSTTTANAFSFSITNIGGANGTVGAGAVTLEPGQTIEYSSKVGNTLAAFAYNATGTTFLILETI